MIHDASRTALRHEIIALALENITGKTQPSVALWRAWLEENRAALPAQLDPETAPP